MLKRALFLKGLAASAAAFAVSLSLPAELTVVSPAENAEVCLLAEDQMEFISMDAMKRRVKMTDAEWRKELKEETGYNPQKVKFKWRGTKRGAECNVTVRRMPDGKVVFREKVKGHKIKVDNLEIARTYEFEVVCGDESAKRTFHTKAHGPRFVRIDGVPNVRDLGGYVGLGGRKIRQGMAFRSGGLNGNANKYYKKDEILALYKAGKLVESVPELSREAAKEIKRHLDAGEEDKANFKHLVKKWMPGPDRMDAKSRAEAMRQFGFRTDLDLRTVRECYGMTGSPLGPDVKWVNIPSPSYGPMHEEYGHDAFAKCFRLFLDEKNYPIDFHCIGGADRAGSVAFLVGAVLGMFDDDLDKDWDFTCFVYESQSFGHESRFDKLRAVFDAYPGATTREKVEAYLKELGFGDEDFQKLRRIMLEPVS